MGENAEFGARVRALASYLCANPHACDTAEGIQRWWLGGAYEDSMDELQEVLDWMARSGLMEQTVAADGRRRYRRSGTPTQWAALLSTHRQGP